MAGPYDIESLRAQVARDLEVYKSEKAHFYRLQGMKPEKITQADRNSIINWSRASISDYSAQLERMEELDETTKEQREVMQLLNQLIMLGDEIGEFTSRFVKDYEAKFGKAQRDAETLLDSIFEPNDGKAGVRNVTDTPQVRRTPSDSGQSSMPLPPTAMAAMSKPEVKTRDTQPDRAASPANIEPRTPQPAKTVSPPGNTLEQTPKPPATPEADLQGELFDDTDPKGAYSMLGVSPSAPMADVQKAIRRKQMHLHPDRNAQNPEAAERFAEFMALCQETVKTEEKRQAYDSIKTVDELEKLTKRVRQLTMGAGNPS